jgi:hypothetical protein
VPLDFCKVAEWIGLTPQQFDILKCVHLLYSNNSQASPKEIQAEYKRLTGKYLMKPNLFNILRTLKSKGCLKQSGYGAYIVDFTGLRRILECRKRELDKERESFDTIYGSLDTYFLEIVAEIDKPIVKYYGYSDAFNILVSRLERSTKLYATSRFPMVAYSIDLAKRLRIENYHHILWQKCIEEKTLTINYTTNLDIEYLIKQHLRAGFTVEQAYKGCLNVINTLETYVEDHPELCIYLPDQALGLDIILSEKVAPEDFIIFMRNEQNLILGGVYIKSKATALTAKNHFIATCNRAMILNSDNAAAVFNKVRINLDNFKQRKITYLH